MTTGEAKAELAVSEINVNEKWVRQRFNVVTQTNTNQRNTPGNSREKPMKTKDETIESRVSELKEWSPASVETINLTNWN